VVSVTFPDPRERIIGTVGTPVAHTEIRLVLDGKDVANGEEGELWVAGPQVMQGYWNNPEATAEVIVEEGGKRWFRTGDLVSLVDDGFMKVTGRSKEQYKVILPPLLNHLYFSISAAAFSLPFQAFDIHF
jgi:long-subunit acyl-CoA synthetase (AMP-forming)